MMTNAFIGKSKKPTEKELATALGAAKSLWDQLLAELADELKIVGCQWNSYSSKAGWSMRLKVKKRNILYLVPCSGSFYVAFALGDKSVQEARQSKLPKRVVKIIDESKRYAEGTGVRIEMKKSKDVEVVKILAAIKLDN